MLLMEKPAEAARLCGLTRLTDTLHGRWIREMVFGQGDMTLLAHRGSYKTTCLSFAMAVMLVVYPRKNLLFLRKTDSDVLEVLRFLPRNASKRFPKLTPHEAARRAKANGDIATISPANANSIMSNFSSFLNWGVNEELLSRNFRLPDPVAKRDKRMPFDPQQLRAIFDAPLYRGCADGERGYNKVGYTLHRLDALREAVDRLRFENVDVRYLALAPDSSHFDDE